ncbi:MAG: putative cytokinetic ring protein SteA [Ornithinimicrobium sp.]
MSRASRPPRSAPRQTVIQGTLRVDARTKNLTKRLQPGDIAVINHEDLDQVSASALVACRPAAVVNAAASTSGAYPNLGPSILLEAEIPVIDAVGAHALVLLHEGAQARIEGGTITAEGSEPVHGTPLGAEGVAAALEEAKTHLSTQIEDFARNTMHYVQSEQHLLLDGIDLPVLRTPIQDRYVLVVVRGYHYKEDLLALRPFIREESPVLVGVDGGADALIELGMRPDLIVGDMDSVSDATLTSGAEVVVHAYQNGEAPGLARVHALGVSDAIVLPATGTSEDIAMLLADGLGARLIVAVGTHATLVEFLDKGRRGMASTFLTRLRVGGKLVDAKGVSLLYRSRISAASLTWLVLAGLVAMIAALASTAGGRASFGVLQVRLDDVIAWLGGWF